MTMLDWSDRLAVNIKEIDGQHKQLVDMINELYDAMMAGQADSVLMGIVCEMKKYAASHFALEEKYMKDHAYPEFTDHKAEHDKFTAKVLQVEKDCASGNSAMSMDVLHFLSSWLLEHIKGKDKKYGPYLNERGVK